MGTTRTAVPPLTDGLTHAERDACLHALGELHAAGQLTFPDLETRIKAALAAKTADELAGLIRDRPGDEPETQSSFGGEAEATTPPRPTQAIHDAVTAAARTTLAVVVTLGRALVTVGAVLLACVVAAVAGSYDLSRRLVRRSAAALTAMRRSHAPALASSGQGSTESQDLAVAPRPQVPMQREAIKVYAVRVPISEPESSPELDTPSQPELPSAARLALPAGQAARGGDHVESADSSVDDEQSGEVTGKVVGQLRPLLDRVTHRVHVRRSDVVPRQRTADAMGWRWTR